jgi:carbonic anhydrase
MLDLRTRHLPAITHDGVQYTLRDIALHAPSEHAVGGVRFDAELQLVHIAPGPRFVLSAQSYFNKAPHYCDKECKLACERNV